MKGFDNKYKSFPDFILKITKQIWEGKDVNSIANFYTNDIPVRSPFGVTYGNKPVIDATFKTLKEFPNRQLLGEDVIWNGLAVVNAHGEVIGSYDKRKLVPFGEYIPFRKWIAFAKIITGGLDFSSGKGPTNLTISGLPTFRPLICYEAVFPQDVGGAPGRADLLLHLTNDAWFGTWSGPYQHLSQSRIRAIEQRLPMLRAANTGVSAVIDGGGRVIAQRGLGEAGVVDARVPPPMAPSFYATTGDLPFFLLLLVLTAAVFVPNGRIPIDPRLNRP